MSTRYTGQEVGASQFHYGSIQIIAEQSRQKIEELSQFHYGSIQINENEFLMTAPTGSQFHYGSIQITTAVETALQAVESQFHYGSIQIHRQRQQKRQQKQVSIPLWFDSNPKSKTTNTTFKESVSIPLWFDSNILVIQKAMEMPVPGLNSTMVRFKS